MFEHNSTHIFLAQSHKFSMIAFDLQCLSADLEPDRLDVANVQPSWIWEKETEWGVGPHASKRGNLANEVPHSRYHETVFDTGA